MVLAVLIPAAHWAQSSTSSDVVTFQLDWKFDKNLPIELKTVLAASNEIKRISETGLVSGKVPLRIAKVLDDGKVRVRRGEQAVIYLFIKNTGSRLLRFSVAPHSTDPGIASLGFHFSCLCNGHIYEVPPQGIWYRIMSLATKKTIEDSSVKLVHQIFEVKSEAKPAKKSAHHFH